MVDVAITKRMMKKSEGLTRKDLVAKAFLLPINERTISGRMLKETINSLTEHVGGNPTPTEQIAIQIAAGMWVRMARLSPELIEGDGAGDEAFLEWSAALHRYLKSLGFKKASGRKMPTLTDMIEDGEEDSDDR